MLRCSSQAAVAPWSPALSASTHLPQQLLYECRLPAIGAAGCGGGSQFIILNRCTQACRLQLVFRLSRGSQSPALEPECQQWRESTSHPATGL